jgi:hypothetical protein
MISSGRQMQSWLFAATFGLAGLAIPAFAQSVSAPLREDEIVVPDLSSSGSPQVVSNGWKYFFFRSPDATYEMAHFDISECYRFLTPTGWANVGLRRFVPWQSLAGTQTIIQIPSPYGLVGDLIGGAVEGTLLRRDRQSKMRRCMETRGYIRYGVAEEIWENVIKLPAEKSIAIQAKIASGPDFGGKVPEK